jgi:hypothetical protein
MTNKYLEKLAGHKADAVENKYLTKASGILGIAESMLGGAANTIKGVASANAPLIKSLGGAAYNTATGIAKAHPFATGAATTGAGIMGAKAMAPKVPNPTQNN